MRLVTKIKLACTFEEKTFLKATLRTCAKACEYISSVVFLSNITNKIDLQKLLYFEIREAFGLSSQMAILCVHKTAHDYHGKGFSQRHYLEKSSMGLLMIGF